MDIVLTGEYIKGDSINIYTDNILQYSSKNKKIIDKRMCIHKNLPKETSLIKKFIGAFLASINIVQDIKKIYKKNQNVGLIVSQTHYNNIFKLCSFLKIKKSVIVHDLFYLNWYKNQKNFIKKILYYLIFNFGHNYFLLKYDNIIAISEKTKEELIKAGIKENKIKVIYNGISHAFFYPKKTLAKKQKTNEILCVGMEYPRKNIEGTILAFDKIKKIHKEYIIIKIGGFEDSPNRERIINFIHENTNLKIGKDIIFKNMVSETTLRNYYQNALFLSFPSFEEGFGFPIVEGEACGCPVITSNLNPMKGLVPYKELLVNPMNIDDLSEKMEILIKSKEKEYVSYCEQGIDFSKKFDWKLTVEKLIELF